jgi:hypothetical protein
VLRKGRWRLSLSRGTKRKATIEFSKDEIPRVLVGLNHIARFIEKANHGVL